MRILIIVETDITRKTLFNTIYNLCYCHFIIIKLETFGVSYRLTKPVSDWLKEKFDEV